MANILGTPSDFTVTNGTAPAAQIHPSTAIGNGSNRVLLVGLAIVDATDATMTVSPTADSVPMVLIGTVVGVGASVVNRLNVYALPISDLKSGSVNVVVTRNATTQQYAGKMVFCDSVNPVSVFGSVASALGTLTQPTGVVTSPGNPANDLALAFYMQSDSETVTSTESGDGTQVGLPSYATFVGSGFLEAGLFVVSSVGLAAPSFKYTASALTGSYRWRTLAFSLNHLLGSTLPFVQVLLKLRGT